MNKKIIVFGILAIVVVAAFVFFYSSQKVTPPITPTTAPATTAQTTVPANPITSQASLVESQAYDAIDQELSSATQGISGSDVQNAMTS